MVTTYLNGVPSINLSYTFAGNNTYTGTQLIKLTSTTALRVQNASASNILIVDTSTPLITANAPIVASTATSNGSNIYQLTSTVTAATTIIAGNDSATGTNQDQITIKANNAGTTPNINIQWISGGGSAITYDTGSSATTDQQFFKIGGTTVMTLGNATAAIVTTNKVLATNGHQSKRNAYSTSPQTLNNNNEVVVITTGAGGFTVNLPAATGSGQVYRIIKGDSGAGAVTITPNGADTINGAASISLATQYKNATLVDGASAIWYDFSANLV